MKQSWYEACFKNWRWWVMLLPVTLLSLLGFVLWLTRHAFAFAHAAIEVVEDDALSPIARAIKNWTHAKRK